jgi:hypothetical protein
MDNLFSLGDHIDTTSKKNEKLFKQNLILFLCFILKLNNKILF